MGTGEGLSCSQPSANQVSASSVGLKALQIETLVSTDGMKGEVKLGSKGN